MSTGVVVALRNEETELLRQLGTYVPMQRLLEVRRLLDLYTQDAPVGAAFDALIAQAAERNHGDGAGGAARWGRISAA